MLLYCEEIRAEAKKLDSVARADHDPWRDIFFIETKHQYDDGRPITLYVIDDEGVAACLIDLGEAFKPPGYTGMDDIDAAYFGPEDFARLRDAAATCNVTVLGADDERSDIQLSHPIEQRRDVAGALASMIEACKAVSRLVDQAHSDD